MWCHILLIDNSWNTEYKEKLELTSIPILFAISFLRSFKGNSERIKNDTFAKEDNVKKKKSQVMKEMSGTQGIIQMLRISIKLYSKNMLFI